MREHGMRGVSLMAALAVLSSVRLDSPSHEPKELRQRSEIRPVHRKSPRLNRSRYWPFAETYKEARAMSPSDRPVR